MAYCIREDIEKRYGTMNVSKWADLDNDEDVDKITANIVAAIAYADSEIDDRLRGSIYDIPIISPPTSIVMLAAVIAGVWLYESRGVVDFDAETKRAQHRLSFNKKDAYNKLRAIQSGSRRIDAAKSLSHCLYPEKVDDE